jgi:hypothetical protein
MLIQQQIKNQLGRFHIKTISLHLEILISIVAVCQHQSKLFADINH